MIDWIVGGLAFIGGLTVLLIGVALALHLRDQHQRARAERAARQAAAEAGAEALRQQAAEPPAQAAPPVPEPVVPHADPGTPSAEQDASNAPAPVSAATAPEAASGTSASVIHPELEALLHLAFTDARRFGTLTLTLDIVVTNMITFGETRELFIARGIDVDALRTALAESVARQPRFAQEVPEAEWDPQPHPAVQRAVQRALQRASAPGEVTGTSLLRTVLEEQDETVEVLARHGVTVALLFAQDDLPEPLSAIRPVDLARALPLPPLLRPTMDRIAMALDQDAVPAWLSPRGAQVLFLCDVSDREESVAALSVARSLPRHRALRLTANTLIDQPAVCRAAVLRVAAATKCPVLLWIVDMPALWAQSESMLLAHARSTVHGFLEAMTTAPSSLCLMFSFDPEHAEAPRMRRSVPHSFELHWPLPTAHHHRALIEELSRRDPTLLPSDSAAFVDRVVAMSQGMSLGDLAELLRQARQDAWMQDKAWPDVTVLQAAQAELRRRWASQSGGQDGHVASRARVQVSNDEGKGMDALAGMEDAKRELERYRRVVAERPRLVAAGCRVPRGMLLVGPPGVGKTAIARAFAKSLGRPFFSQSAAEFVELYVGTGPARVRNLFRNARASQPSVIFLDEIDAIGARRHGHGQHVEDTKTLNQLLVEMDGFQTNDSVFVMAATNRAETLDEALTRAGRFDICIHIHRPDPATRRQILLKLLDVRHTLTDGDIQHFIDLTDRYVGAEIENIVNRARLGGLLDHDSDIVHPDMLLRARDEVEATRAAARADDADWPEDDLFGAEP